MDIKIDYPTGRMVASNVRVETAGNAETPDVLYSGKIIDIFSTSERNPFIFCSYSD